MTTDSQKDTNVSDYEAEWGREDDTSNAQGVDTNGGGRQTPNPDTAQGEGAPDEDDGKTSYAPNGNPAEGGNEDDVWANVPETAREAYRRAEKELLALKGQTKALNDRLSHRGRELKELRDKTASLEESTREKTAFEREFPEYAEDIRAITGTGKAPQTQALSAEEIEAATVQKIQDAHPDAGDLYNTTEFHAFLANDPLFVFNDQPMRLATAVHSDNADEIIAALSHYKTTHAAKQPDPKDALKDMVAPAKSGGKPDLRSAANLTPQQQYDAAWEQND